LLFISNLLLFFIHSNISVGQLGQFVDIIGSQQAIASNKTNQNHSNLLLNTKQLELNK
jgi:hypothetical protein